jgi:hypothetical protein
MKQEDKEFLLKDLCAILPYGVKMNHIADNEHSPKTLIGVAKDMITLEGLGGYECVDVEDYKPYLFPLSSMTEEQKRELLELTGYEARCEESCGFDSWGFYINIVGEYKYEDNQESIILYPDDIGIDWCNKNHFDYRGLIEKGIALDATGQNIY